MIVDTANCTIEGRHINVSNNWEPSNSTKYVITAMKAKELIVFSKQNETTISLEGFKIVSRVIRKPWLPTTYTKIDKPNIGGWDKEATTEEAVEAALRHSLTYPTTIGTPDKQWNMHCLHEHLYDSLLGDLNKLTQFISTSWCVRQWKEHGKPDSGWQYYALGHVMFACNWPHGKFSLSLSNIKTNNKDLEQQKLFQQWSTTAECMLKASNQSFPKLAYQRWPGKLPNEPTPLECLWYGGDEHTKWEKDRSLYPVGVEYVNQIFEPYINPSINKLKTTFPQCYQMSSNYVTYKDVAHLTLSKPAKGIIFKECATAKAIYTQPPQTLHPMLILSPTQDNETLYYTDVDVKSFGIMQSFHVCKNNDGWHIPLFDVKLTTWQSQLSKLAHDWVNQSSVLHLLPAYHPSIAYIDSTAVYNTNINLTLPSFPYSSLPCERSSRIHQQHWSSCSWKEFLNHIKSEGKRKTTLAPKTSPKWIYKKAKSLSLKAYLLELKSSTHKLTNNMLYQYLNLTKAFTQKQLDQMIISLTDKTSTIEAVSVVVKTTFRLRRYIIYGEAHKCQVTPAYTICRINAQMAVIFKSNFNVRFQPPIKTSAVHPVSPDFMNVNHAIEQIQHHGKIDNHNIWITTKRMILDQDLNQPPQFSFPLGGEEEHEVSLQPTFPNRIIWDGIHYLVREEEGLHFYTELNDVNITEILPKREFMGVCYRYPIAVINDLPKTICSWPENYLIALQQIAIQTNITQDKLAQQWIEEKTTNPTSNIKSFAKKHNYPCTVMKNNPSALFEIKPSTNILVQPQRIPCESQLPVMYQNNQYLYDHEGYPLPKQYQTTLPDCHSQSTLRHLAEVDTLENIMIKDRMERHESQYVKSFSSLEENQHLLANKASKNALKEIKDFEGLAKLSYELSHQVQANKAGERELQNSIEQDHQQIHLFRHNILAIAQQLKNQSLSIFQIHEVQVSHTRILDYLVPELKDLKTQLQKDEKLLRLIPQQIKILANQVVENRDKLNTLNQTELELVQRVTILQNRVQLNSAREDLLKKTVQSVKSEQNVIKTTQRLDEEKIKDNTKRIDKNLRAIHLNSKRISKVNARLTKEINDRIQGDKDTLEAAKKYTDSQVKKAANEPWYDKIVDFFKNLPSELKKLLAWIKKIDSLDYWIFLHYLCNILGKNVWI